MTSTTGAGTLFRPLPPPATPLVAPLTPVPATLESNLSDTLAAIATETDRAGRPQGGVDLLAVTKSVGVRTASELVRLGQRDLGENRLPSLLAKRAQLKSEGLDVTWHYIGQIQRNKARKVVQNSEVLHSVDSLRLIETLERIAAEEGRRVDVYLEVKLSDEDAKHGFTVEELDAAVELAGRARHLELVGLMTMAPRPDESTPEPRETFARLAEIGARLEADPQRAELFRHEQVRLSMGMSGDFQAAIAAGSDVVRIGSALYRGLETDSPTGEVTS